MNKLKTIIEWTKQNSKLIIISLLIILMLKGCGSCTTERRYEYQINKYETQIDSLKADINKYEIEYKRLNDSLSEKIHILESNNLLLQNAMDDARKDIEYQRRVNSGLMDVTKNLSNNNETN